MYGGGVCFRKDSGFQCTHENVSVDRCHLCTHGCALFLGAKFIVNSENVFVENEFWRNSGEIAHRSGTIDGVPRPRRIEIRANTGSYVHVRCEKGL